MWFRCRLRAVIGILLISFVFRVLGALAEPRTEAANSRQKRNLYTDGRGLRFGRDHQQGSGAKFKKHNHTEVIASPGGKIAETDQRHFNTVYITATVLYFVAAVYGILHLPVWSTFYGIYKRNRVEPSLEMEDRTGTKTDTQATTSSGANV
ncbi:hypothetical protein FKM82_000094 [Ascaphus truei]